MRIIEAKDWAALEVLRKRKIDFSLIVEQIRPVVQEVRANGDEAIRKFVKKFDKRDLHSIAVCEDARKASEGMVSQSLKEALAVAKKNIISFHACQLPKEWWVEIMPGIEAGQLVRPLARVGCYIPGGKYPLVSTVLMTVLPAKVAGVQDIIVCTPKASPEILYACEFCGVDKIFEVGGAMAISAMAYGTKTIPKVDKVVGPGNIYVTAAKKIVYGDVGIDFIAGPSEIVVIADQKADPAYIAADLLAQAEHDETAMSLCITPSRTLAAEVSASVEQMLERLPTRGTARASLDARGAIIVVDSLEKAFSISNFLSPEHLEIHIEDTGAWLGLVENAGSVFLGKNASEAAGDYAVGPNHVLPTGGFASAQSGLSVRDFIKTPTVQRLSDRGVREIGPTVITLAEAEGLAGHAESMKVRMRC